MMDFGSAAVCSQYLIHSYGRFGYKHGSDIQRDDDGGGGKKLKLNLKGLCAKPFSPERIIYS